MKILQFLLVALVCTAAITAAAYYVSTRSSADRETRRRQWPWRQREGPRSRRRREAHRRPARRSGHRAPDGRTARIARHPATERHDPAQPGGAGEGDAALPRRRAQHAQAAGRQGPEGRGAGHGREQPEPHDLRAEGADRRHGDRSRRHAGRVRLGGEAAFHRRRPLEHVDRLRRLPPRLRAREGGRSRAIDVEDGGPPIEAHIDYVSPLGASDTQSSIARAVVANDGRLRPGLFVDGRVVLAAQPVDIAVKSSALQTLEGKTVVFVREGDTFAAREVELGDRDADWVEICSASWRATSMPRRTASSSRPRSARRARRMGTKPQPHPHPDGGAEGRSNDRPYPRLSRSIIAGWSRRRPRRGRARRWNFSRLPIDAVPDITNVQVQINTVAPALRRWRSSSTSPFRSRRRWAACRSSKTRARCRGMASRR